MNKKLKDFVKEDDERIYGKPLRRPILGKHFSLPGKSATEQRIKLNTSLPFTPVFTHLKIHEAGDIECPGTPPIIRKISNEEYMDFYMPSTSKKDDLPSNSKPLKGPFDKSVTG